VLYALLFLPALLAIAYVVLRWRRPQLVAESAVVDAPSLRQEDVREPGPVATVVMTEPEPVASPTPTAVVRTEAVPEPVAQISGEADPLQALETLLAELERATLDERDVEELERLAEQLEATARELERVG
jgi:hypothetical protein